MTKGNWIAVVTVTLLWFIGAIGLYIYSKDIQQLFFSINFFAVIIATTINLLSALEQVRSRKTDNTFKYMEMWDDSLLTEARKYTRDILQQSNTKAPDQIYEDIDKNIELKKSIVSVFNFWQLIYLSIEAGRVEKRTLERAFSGAYKKFYETFQCWRQNHIKYSDPKGYADLDKLYKMWNK